MIVPIGFHAWRTILLDHFGPDALFSVDPTLSSEQLVERTNKAYEAQGDSPEAKAARAAYNGVWVMDLTHGTPVLARKIGWGFFAVVIDDVGYTQPVTVEEPDPGHPLQSLPGFVGKIQAMIAKSPEGAVFVKTVEVARPVATGKGGPKIMELDRTSNSRGAPLAGAPVGVPSYINSARLRGAVQGLSSEAPPEALSDPGWVPVVDFFRNSPDIPGRAVLITALVQAGLVSFG